MDHLVHGGFGGLEDGTHDRAQGLLRAYHVQVVMHIAREEQVVDFLGVGRLPCHVPSDCQDAQPVRFETVGADEARSALRPSPLERRRSI